MSDGLVVGGGGPIVVATEELLACAASCAAVAAQAEAWAARLRAVSALVPGASVRWGDEAAWSLIEAGLTATRLGEDAQRLRGELLSSSDDYVRAEQTLARISGSWGSILGYSGGLLWPALALAAVPALATAGTGAVLALLGTSMLRGRSPASVLSAVSAAVRGRPELYSNPAVVHLVRVLVSSADDAMLGAARIPRAPERSGSGRSGGESGAGALGITGAATVVSWAVRPAGLGETPVAVRRAGVSVAAPPRGYAELAARMPSSASGSAQIRIERYEVPAPPSASTPTGAHRTRWIVYTGGTIDSGLRTASEPWDMASNLAGIADDGGGSYRATLEAMRAAGIEQGDEVLSVGYSQGGLVAARIVESGEFASAGLVTFGSPSEQIAAPEGVPVTAIRHEEDLIPALGGMADAEAGRGSDPGAVDGRLTVRRALFDESPPPSDEAFPAHSFERYRETAALLDESGEERISRAREGIETFTAGAHGTSVLYRATRVEQGETR
ncbi:hypothetical protein [Compostimonas suwonensis]|uniref:Alpha/beta hydrolase family protein n=1 Tax=Compostimonas suwonensis TaxID=1048394 RepID=A0A2M9C469_9MICO|nr:hypothetical protein [Compostimonas suwonensis]PJJ65324.1 hypothetical protein CLV54_0356 [Compostimonas suwonensis]